MTGYRPPVEQMLRTMQVAGLDEVLALQRYASVDLQSVRDVLEGLGRLASEVIAPTDRVGDLEGARLDQATGHVTVPPALCRAFDAFVAGWCGLGGSADVGGGAFPKVAAIAVHEIFGSANLALSLNPMLTASAVEFLQRCGDERQRARYLAPLVKGAVAGRWRSPSPRRARISVWSGPWRRLVRAVDGL